MISSINPSTGEVLAEYEEYSDQKINECIEKAELAYHSYQKTSLNKKISLMLNAASILEKQKEGKKRMKQLGTVEVPQEAFLAVLKVD